MFGHPIKMQYISYSELIHDIDQSFKLSLKSILSAKFPRTFGWHWQDEIMLIRTRRNHSFEKLINQRRIDRKNGKIASDNLTYVDVTSQLVDDGKMTQDEQISDCFFLFAAG